MNEKVWNDRSRSDLRETLRTEILGELLLNNREHEEILEFCRDVYVGDDCPKQEVKTFLQFAADELDRSAKQLATEKARWLEETDCDRLDRVEETLRNQGILLWQVSPCCDTCTGSEIPDRIAIVNQRHPGFIDRLRGYAFFIDQSMPEMLTDSTQISIYLSYGWISPDGSEVAPDIYKKNALGIAREVCDSLRSEGFEVDWNGNYNMKICVSLNWQRRTMLQ